MADTEQGDAPRIHKAVDYWAKHIVDQVKNMVPVSALALCNIKRVRASGYQVKTVLKTPKDTIPSPTDHHSFLINACVQKNRGPEEFGGEVL